MLPIENKVKELGFADITPNISIVKAAFENAQDAYEMKRYSNVVENLELALTSYHEIVDFLRPQESSNR